MEKLHVKLDANYQTPVLSELETCAFRNRSFEETASYMAPILEKHLPLHSNSSRSSALQLERRRDHYSHFILRLAFAGTEDLRRRFARLETTLFRLRLRDDDSRERSAFMSSLDLHWEKISDAEKEELGSELKAASSGLRGKSDEEGWFKVDWERVPELVERRAVLLKRGKAYVPAREQQGMVVTEFTRRLEDALEVSYLRQCRMTPVLIFSTALRSRSSTTRRGRPPRAHFQASFQLPHHT
jgi:DNA primase large subunit